MNTKGLKVRCAIFRVAFLQACAVLNERGGRGLLGLLPPIHHCTGYPWQVARQQSLRPFRRMSWVLTAVAAVRNVCCRTATASSKQEEYA